MGVVAGAPSKLEHRFAGSCWHAVNSKAGQTSSLGRDRVQFLRRNMDEGQPTTQAAALRMYGPAAALGGNTALIPNQAAARQQAKRSKEAKSGGASKDAIDPSCRFISRLLAESRAVAAQDAAAGSGSEPVEGFLQALSIYPDILAISTTSPQLRIAHHLCCAGREHSQLIQSDSTERLVSQGGGRGMLVSAQLMMLFCMPCKSATRLVLPAALPVSALVLRLCFLSLPGCLLPC